MTSKSVIVAGGGPAGLASAILLAQDGIRTTLAAPVAATDPRTIALMQPSINLLRYIGVWTSDLESACAALKELHIADDTGNYVTAPRLEFNSSEISASEFGWNVPLALLIPALRARAEAAGVEIVAQPVASAQPSTRGISVTLADGQTFQADCAIAADGAESVMRRAAGIKTEAWSYDQSALVTTFEHSGPHHNISTEYHKAYGVFTTVPMPGNASSLVWMDKPARIQAAFDMSEADLATELQLELHGALGLITHRGPKKIFKMRGARAERFAANRVYLVGEAAHVMPPIGAQGLNMSLRDAGFAADLIVRNDDPGAVSVLAEYNAVRTRDVTLRMTAVGVVNQSLLTELAIGDLSRAAAFSAIRLLPPLRKFVVETGLQPSSDLPFAMRAA
jgi:2-octaprenyl-6-methoxyphenol hydroxylase